MKMTKIFKKYYKRYYQWLRICRKNINIFKIIYGMQYRGTNFVRTRCSTWHGMNPRATKCIHIIYLLIPAQKSSCPTPCWWVDKIAMPTTWWWFLLCSHLSIHPYAVFFLPHCRHFLQPFLVVLLPLSIGSAWLVLAKVALLPSTRNKFCKIHW